MTRLNGAGRRSLRKRPVLVLLLMAVLTLLFLSFLAYRNVQQGNGVSEDYLGEVAGIEIPRGAERYEGRSNTHIFNFVRDPTIFASFELDADALPEYVSELQGGGEFRQMIKLRPQSESQLRALLDAACNGYSLELCRDWEDVALSGGLGAGSHENPRVGGPDAPILMVAIDSPPDAANATVFVSVADW